MPNWNEIHNEIEATGSTHDVVRRRYLSALHELTGRNVIVYYSGWLQKPNLPGVEINDADKNGFMSVIYQLDRNKGLDLVLHTPGGDTAATESLVDYLRSMFRTDIRAIVPQLAMSAGTMVACACREIIMGKHSSLGPIDPQISGIPAHGIVEEFCRAKKETQKDHDTVPLWQLIVAKYPPTLIGECEKAIAWCNEMTRDWLLRGMFKGTKEARSAVCKIVTELADHSVTKTHARHLSAEHCSNIGLKVVALEDDPHLQQAVLSLHHSCIHTLGSTPAFKLIENHNGIAFIQTVREVIVQ